LGDAVFAKGDFAAAAAYYARSKQLNPAHSETAFKLAMAQLRLADAGLSDYAVAGDHFNKAYLLESNLNYKILHAYCQQRQGNYDLAIQVYKEVLQKGRKTAELCNNLGWLYSQKSDLKPAQQFLESALAINNDMPAAHYNLAVVYLQKARDAKLANEKKVHLDKGLDHFQRAAKNTTMSAIMYLIGATLCVEAAHYDSTKTPLAVDNLRRAIVAGLPTERLLQDSTFDSIKSLSAFDELLSLKTLGSHPRNVDFSIAEPLSK